MAPVKCRFILVLAIIIWGACHKLYAQDLPEKMSTAFCNCFTINVDSLKDDFLEDNFMECIEESFRRMQKDFTNYVVETEKIDPTSNSKENSEIAYEAGYKMSQNILKEQQGSWIKDCPSYYQFYTEIRAISFQTIRKQSNQRKIDSLTTVINKLTLKKHFLWERGTQYFALGDIKNARKDFLACLVDDSEYVPAIYFLGWTYEQKEEYEKASSLYSQALKLSDMPQIQAANEFVNRKLKEKNKP